MLIAPDKLTLLSTAMSQAVAAVGFEGSAIDSLYTGEARSLCPRVSLHPAGELLGLPLATLVGPTTNIDFFDFVQVYEDFIKVFLIDSPRMWVDIGSHMARQLNIEPEAARFYFTQAGHQNKRERFEHKKVIVMALAQTAFSNFGGEVLKANGANFIVEVAGARFGISKGGPVSNYHDTSRVPGRMLARYGLQTLWRPGGLTLRQPQLEDRAFRFLRSLRKDLPDSELLSGMLTATTILKDLAPGELSKMLQVSAADDDGPVVESKVQVLRMAKDFDTAQNAYQYLQNLIVPICVSRREFRQRFSPNRRPGPRLAERWRSHLDEIERAVRHAG